MGRLAFIPILALLTGCHSGPVGAAAMSGGFSVLTIVNQDVIQDQLSALRFTRAARSTPPSGTTAP